MKRSIVKINQKIKKLENEIWKLRFKEADIQAKCPHINATWKCGDTRAFQFPEKVLLQVYRCPDCNAIWTVTEHLGE